MSSLRSQILLAVLVSLALGALPARADQCAGAKLKAIGSKEAGLLGVCQAKVAATGDASDFSVCESKWRGKFGDAFRNAGICAGDPTACEDIADGCASSVAGAFVDTFPSNCETKKREAAGKLGKSELGCYARAAAKGFPVDTVTCIPKAQARFSDALTKAGTCPDGGSPQTLVESHCINPAVTTNGGIVIDVCSTTMTTTTTTTTTTFPPCTTVATSCGGCGSGFCLSTTSQYCCESAGLNRCGDFFSSPPGICVGFPIPTASCLTDQDCSGIPGAVCMALDAVENGCQAICLAPCP